MQELQEVSLTQSFLNESTVKFNCGGKLFEIKYDTLKRYPDSMLCRRVESGIGVKDNFIDRSYVLFEIILEYYRKNIVFIPYNLPFYQIKTEFEFYGFDWDELNVRFVNVNDLWKKNIKIRTMEKIIDNFVTSSWFQNKIKTELIVNWIIGPPIEHFKYYDIFQISLVSNAVITYIKKKYNVNARWINILKFEKEFITYYDNKGESMPIPIEEVDLTKLTFLALSINY